MSKLLGHIVSVDSLKAGDQVPRLVLRHKFEITAPLVLHPHSVVILIVCAKRQHELRTVERGKDVRLVFRTKLVLQRDAAEKHSVALFRQRIIHILRDHAVDRALTVFIRFLIADENIIGRLLAGDLYNSLTDILDRLGLIAIDSPSNGIRVFARLLKIAVLQNRVKGRTMTGGHLSSGSGVIHIFDTVTAQDKPPIGLGFLGEVRHDALIYARRLVELTGQPQSVGSAEQSQLLFIVNLGNSLLCAAIFALGNSFAFYDLQISSAHFTFDHSHILSPSKNNYFSVNSIWSMANSRHFSKSSFLGRPDFAARLSISPSMSFGILTDTTAVSPLYRLIGIWSFSSSIPLSPPTDYLLYRTLYYNCIHLSTYISDCTNYS